MRSTGVWVLFLLAWLGCGGGPGENGALAHGWAPLGWAHEQPEGYDSDVYRWLDSKQQQRTAVLTRNEARDPGGSHGGMLRRYRILVDSQERVATGTGASGLWNGWGYVVSHYDKTVARSADLPGRHRQVFLGRHHAVHEFSWDLPIREALVKVTVHWFFATGRDHPVYAITFDTREAGPAGLAPAADSRAPYGALNWDGDGTDALVDGVKWGDKYRFASLDEPLTAQSRWDYSEPNVVPYALTYSRTADAEMGAVQTVSWKEHNTGSTWFYDNWGRTSDNPVDSGGFDTWRMPASWNWPYQLCQYEMDDTEPTRSKRLSWGLMYGAVGRPSYWGYGYERRYTGHPYQSYSVFMVMGRQSTADVLAQVTQVERLLQTQLRATQGHVVRQGPGGVAREDAEKYPVAGYNSTYGVHELLADRTGGFTLTLDTGGRDLRNPIFLIRGMGGLPGRLTLEGKELVADRDYFASYDAATDAVWLTLNRVWSGSHTLAGGRP